MRLQPPSHLHESRQPADADLSQSSTNAGLLRLMLADISDIPGTVCLLRQQVGRLCSGPA